MHVHTVYPVLHKQLDTHIHDAQMSTSAQISPPPTPTTVNPLPGAGSLTASRTEQLTSALRLTD